MEIVDVVPVHESSQASLQENAIKLLMYMGEKLIKQWHPIESAL